MDPAFLSRDFGKLMGSLCSKSGISSSSDSFSEVCETVIDSPVPQDALWIGLLSRMPALGFGSEMVANKPHAPRYHRRGGAGPKDSDLETWAHAFEL